MAIYTIDEMLIMKKEYGLSSQLIATVSGVPLSTVQKVFSGITSTPRHQTIIALSKAFDNICAPIVPSFHNTDMVAETSSYGNEYGTGALKINSYENKTLKDYLALPEGTRIEMIDGVFYDMAAPTFLHQRIGGIIFNIFENFIDANGGPCVPSIAPTDVQLDCDDKTMVQPDVLVVCDRNKIIKARVVGAPDLIIEVLSPSNWYMDTNRKLKKYKNAGVREYWIIIPEEKLIWVYEFAKSDKSTEYTFNDTIPVGIWDGRCKVDFKKIFEKISFLYEETPRPDPES
ncbi:Endonuclease, Uma2 family (restriction endonuclease fold) [Eubacterium ruminantium]|nr:Endonuclease, Uma2 family (restriction endonuclease fold) [Eubacterium ruminantium]